MNRAARLQISAQSRSSSMHRAIVLMSCSCKQDAAQCSHAVTHSLQTSIQLSCCSSCAITFLFLFGFVCFCVQRTTCSQIHYSTAHLACSGSRSQSRARRIALEKWWPMYLPYLTSRTGEIARFGPHQWCPLRLPELRPHLPFFEQVADKVASLEQREWPVLQESTLDPCPCG
jgi:hypothetical protein